MTNDREHGARGRRRRLRHQAGAVPAAARRRSKRCWRERVARDAARRRCSSSTTTRPTATRCRGGCAQRGYRRRAWRRTAPRRSRSSAARAFDLVLLDVEMPGMSGLEVLTPRCARTPFADRAARHHGHRPIARAPTSSRRSAWARTTTSPSRSTFPVALARIAHAPVAQVGGRGPARERGAVRARHAAAPTTACGTGTWSTNEVYWSARWKAMLGYDEAEIGASPDEWFSRVHHDDLDRVRGGAGGAPAERKRALRERAPDPPSRRHVPLGALPRRGHPERRRGRRRGWPDR